MRQQSILEATVRVIARSGVRGLRVEKIAAEAGISTALIYYHFGHRAGLIQRTLEFVNDRAAGYTQQAAARADTPRAEVELLLFSELQDTETVRETNAVWGELRASAVFDETLREPLAESSRVWQREVADAIRRTGAHTDPMAAAERLISLVEGLSGRWLSGTTTLDRAHDLLRAAIALELGA